MKKIKAVFTGVDGTMGYKTGQEYELTLKEFKCGGLWVRLFDSKYGSCEYSTTMKFLDNWTKIEVL